MKNSKKSCMPKNQPNANATLFLQLGILLALVIVYHTFELKFAKKVINFPDTTIVTEPDVFVFPPFEIEKPVNTQEKLTKKLPELLSDFVIDNKKNEEPQEDFLVTSTQAPVDFDTIFADVPLIEEIIEDDIVKFKKVEQAPRYPGCKGETEEDYKKCFNAKIKKFIHKKFNPNTDLNIHGKQRIHVQFEINKNGDIVHIEARAPHKSLEKEAIKAVNKLPKMTPGKQRNKAVGVKYNLPIVLFLE